MVMSGGLLVLFPPPSDFVFVSVPQRYELGNKTHTSQSDKNTHKKRDF